MTKLSLAHRSRDLVERLPGANPRVFFYYGAKAVLDKFARGPVFDRAALHLQLHDLAEDLLEEFEAPRRPEKEEEE